MTFSGLTFHSSGFSTEETLIPEYAVLHCGEDKGREERDGNTKKKGWGAGGSRRKKINAVPNISDLAEYIWVKIGGVWPFPCMHRFWENVRPFIPHMHFFSFKVKIRSCTLILLFRPGSVHSGLVS